MRGFVRYAARGFRQLDGVWKGLSKGCGELGWRLRSICLKRTQGWTVEISAGRRFEYWADGLPLLLVSRIDDALHVVYEALPIAETLDRPEAELLYGATEEDPEHHANRQRSAE